MSKQSRKRLLALIWVIAIIILLFYFWSRTVRGLLTWEDALGLIFFFALGMVGTLLVARQPRNPVGWTFFGAFCYLVLDLGFNASLPLFPDRFPDVSSEWRTTLAFIDAYNSEILNVTVWFCLVIFPILYFPNGELPSPRWRYFIRLAVALLILKVAGGLFNPELTSDHFPNFRNPLSVPLIGKITEITELGLIFASVMPPFSLVFRFRGAQGVERQQIKWPLFSALLAAIGIGWAIFASLVFGAREGDPLFTAGVALEAFSVVTFPVSIGVAIFRYRLYDIDIIISRTLQYLVLTTSLGLVYFGSVVLLQTVLPANSPIAVVASTLAVAALFAPLRRRIQDLIDRRFYRKKYDAQRTLAAFGATIRDEVDLDKLSDALVASVVETLQPKDVSLWLRKVEGSPE